MELESSFAPSQALIEIPRVAMRPTRAEIDLDAIAGNLAAIRRVVPEQQVLAIVKADAYGHGLVPVAHRLQAEGVGGFGVALAEEGLDLRASGIESEILVLNGVYGAAHREILEARLTPVLYNIEEALAFLRANRGRPFAVHLKVDTGMGRLGVRWEVLDDFLAKLAAYPQVRIEGLMTQLSSAASDPEWTATQLARFATSLERVRRAGYRPQRVHVAKSAALFLYPESRYETVRPGLALYGYAPDPRFEGFRPAMSVRTQVIDLRHLPVGEPIGYDQTFRTTRPSRIATLPMGYADGLKRSSVPGGTMLCRGQACPIVGNVSMDLTTVDVTDLPGVDIGDEVVWLGEQGGRVQDAHQLAAAAGTTAYEVLTSVSKRVPRVYKGDVFARGTRRAERTRP